MKKKTDFDFDKVFCEMKKDNWNYHVLPFLCEVEKNATEQQKKEVALWLIEQEPSIFDTTVEIFCANYINDKKLKKTIADFCKDNTKISEQRKEHIISALSSKTKYYGF